MHPKPDVATGCTRDDVVAEARSWIGTPIMAQQSLKGVGADCVGLIRGVALATGAVGPVTEADVQSFRAYKQWPSREEMFGGLDRFLIKIPVTDAKAGDVLVFRISGDPRHLGILTEKGTIVHAFTGKKVVEHGYDRVWRDRTLRAYRFPYMVA